MEGQEMQNRIHLQIIRFFLIVVILLTACSSTPPPNEEAASLVIQNAVIYTVDADFSKASALAIRGRYLVYVGDRAGVQAYIGPNTKVLDLQGRTVLPGIIEGHMHLPMLGENLLKIDAYWKPRQAILDAVAARAGELAPGEWILGFGWNNEVWEDKNYPTKEELDAVAPDHPVVLTRTDGHMIWVNSMVLELAGVTRESSDPQGGEILRDAAGNPTGCLTDTAMEPVTQRIPQLSNKRKKEALMKGQAHLLSLGITSLVNAGTTVGDIENMKALYRDGKLHIRIYAFISSAWGEALGDNEKSYYYRGIETGLFDQRLTIRGVKLFADGSLGSRSAALFSDYSDRPGHRGNLIYSDEELYRLVKEARRNGFQVATHAIGDAAVNQVLNVYRRVLQEHPADDHRFRIEHYQVSTLDDIPRLAALGVIPSMQATHATSDKNMAENRIGVERMKGAYAWRTIIDSGSIIVNGSDAPVELANPFHGLYAAVTRMDREGRPAGGWYPHQRMTRAEALKSFTIWAAYGQFEEKLKGSLEAGKLADFVVVDRDYMQCPADEIKEITPLLTVIGGEIRYRDPNL